MADYSLPLVDTLAQLPEQCVAVMVAPSVWCWVVIESQKMNENGETRQAALYCVNANTTIRI